MRPNDTDWAAMIMIVAIITFGVVLVTLFNEGKSCTPAQTKPVPAVKYLETTKTIPVKGTML